MEPTLFSVLSSQLDKGWQRGGKWLVLSPYSKKMVVRSPVVIGGGFSSRKSCIYYQVWMVSVPNDECLGLAPTSSSAGEDECARLPQPNLTLRYNSWGLSFSYFWRGGFSGTISGTRRHRFYKWSRTWSGCCRHDLCSFLELQPELKQTLTVSVNWSKSRTLSHLSPDSAVISH